MNKAYIIQKLSEIADKHDLSISEEVISSAIDFSEFKNYKKGICLKNIDDEAKYVGIVIDGFVRCYYIDGDGNDITRGFAVPGNMCFDEGMIGYNNHICMWETLSESTIMIIEATKLKQLILNDKNLKYLWISLLERALRYKLYRENGFLTENAKERYIHFKKRFPDLSDNMAQRYVATYLGIAPESLSRIRRSLKDE